jgi:hypothetical protein
MIPPAYPELGRLLSLGLETDDLDALAMIAVLRSAAGVRERHGVSNANHMAREALWDCWERPRLPRPLVSGKYPKTWPWSPDARRLYELSKGKRPKKGGWGFVLEHVAPRGLVVTSLIDASIELSSVEFLEKLRLDMRGAVITKQDDEKLLEAKVGRSYPDGVDPITQPWSRYEHAGLDPATFAPLTM